MRRSPFAVVATLATLVLPSSARAQRTAECVAAFDRAQDRVLEGKLIEARAELRVCAHEGCHSMVRRDCAERLERVERDLPTLVFGARDQRGADMTEVVVHLDGRLVDIERAAAGVAVNPGAHEVVFSAPGYEPHHERVVARLGEKNRGIVVGLTRKVDLRAAGPTEAPSRTAPLVLFGVSAAGLGGFAGFGLAGFTEKQALLERCAAACSDAEVAVVRDRYLVADVLLGVSIVALGVATALWVSASAPTPSRAASRLAPP